MSITTQTEQEFINQVKTDLSSIYKTTQPELLASNDLGFLVNFFTHLRYDVSHYINTLYNENNPALATKYSSLFFHASMSGYDIEFSTPATAKLILLIPKKDSTDTSYTYSFFEEDTIVSDSGIKFTLKYDIVVSITNNTIVAYYRSLTEPKRYLPTSVIPDQTDPTKEIYVISLPEVLYQVESTTTFIRVPFYEYRTSLRLKIPQRIQLEELVSLNVFLLPANSSSNAEDLLNLPLTLLRNNNELEALPTSFDQRSISTSNNMLMVDTTSELTIVLGDGISARKFNEGDILIIRTERTDGTAGNLNAFISSFPNVQTRITYDDYTVIENTDISCFIPDGSQNGKTIDDVYTLREKIVRHIFRRNSLVSERDYKIFFESMTGTESIINAFSATNSRHLIAYSILKDKTNQVIKTNTFDINVNFDETHINEFYMDDNPYNEDYIIPFYIVQEKDKQFGYSYFVNNQVQFNVGFKFKEDVDKHIPLLYLKYDYIEKKTYIDLREHDNANYYFSSNVIEGELNESNEYLLYIDPDKLHDKYCFLTEEINNCVLTDTTNGIEYVVSTVNLLSPHQEYVNLYYDDSKRAIARVPFIEKTQMEIYGYEYLYELMRTFFVTNIISEDNLFDMYVSQSFANTTKFTEPYYSTVLDFTDNFVDISPAQNMKFEIIIDMDKFVRDRFDTLNDFEIDLKIFLSKNKPHGFNIKFNELDLEKLISEEYAFVKNARSSLRSFAFKSEPRILKDLDELGLDKMTLYNYTPMYFYINDFSISIKQQ